MSPGEDHLTQIEFLDNRSTTAAQCFSNRMLQEPMAQAPECSKVSDLWDCSYHLLCLCVQLYVDLSIDTLTRSMTATLQDVIMDEEDATLTVVITVFGVAFMALVGLAVLYCICKKFFIVCSNNAFFAKHSRSRCERSD